MTGTPDATVVTTDTTSSTSDLSVRSGLSNFSRTPVRSSTPVAAIAHWSEAGVASAPETISGAM